MDPTSPLAPILEAFESLHLDLVDAQQTPLAPELRTEMARLAVAAKQSLTKLETAHRSAKQTLDAKQQRAVALLAANKQKIAEKQKLLAAKKDPPRCPTPPIVIDPTLGRTLALELLARQQTIAVEQARSPSSGGVLDDWQWRAGATAIALATAAQ